METRKGWASPVLQRPTQHVQGAAQLGDLLLLVTGICMELARKKV